VCGIAGWARWDGPPGDQAAPGRRAQIEAMTASMVCRGPDAGAVWLDAYAAIGHRRLAVIDLTGGGQPMTVADGSGTVVLTFNGEVYNYRELRAELRALGHVFRSESDTEVVLRAYLEWGEALTVRLNGIYAFAVWDQARRQLLLVRDRMGVKPLYYYLLSGGVLFGSEPKAILAHPEVRPVVDAEGFAELLAHAKTPGYAVFRGMHEVKPGHTVRVRPTAVTTRRYWGLEAREHTDDLTTTVATVRGLLKDTVRRQLVADVPLCTLLSGGLDSSLLAALANRALATEGAGPIRSFAVEFAEHAGRFTPDGLRDAPDGPYARMAAEHIGADHHEISLDTATLTDPAHRAAVLRAHDIPWSRGEGDTSLYLLFAAVRHRSTVALSGESADELFGGYRWLRDREAVQADTFPWLAGAAGNTFGLAHRDVLLSPGLRNKLDLPGYRRGRYADALAEVPHRPGDGPEERRRRELAYVAATRFMQILLDRKDRMSMASGLEVRVPFTDHRLVQYVFNTPWAMKTFDGREKSLLRAVATGVLPEPVVHRPKSPYPSTQDPRYARVLRAELGAVLEDPGAPVRPLLDLDAARDAVAGATRHHRTGIGFAVELDRWLRTYGVRLDF